MTRDINESDRAQLARDYFVSLYSATPGETSTYQHRGMFPPLLPTQWDSLEAPVSLDEVKKALFDMKPLKALGPDGLYALFYQSQWDIVGQSLHNMVAAIFHGHCMHESFNNAAIVCDSSAPSGDT